MTSTLRGGNHWPEQQQQQPQAPWHRRHEDNDGYREIRIVDHRPLEETVHEVVEEEEEEEEEEMMDDGSSISSSPSIPDENINFDLVYALHTFVATVEGQASVVKGDALILMEDTNIYWWLVEVLKTHEVGYIPAENIETPYERLARLNKHRNVEITSPSPQLPDVVMEQETPRTRTNKKKNVTIAEGTRVITFEVESEDEQQDEAEEAAEEEEDEFEDAQQEVVNKQPEVVQEIQQTVEGPLETQEMRVFSGNIGQTTTLFHTFNITLATTADELVREAMVRFQVHKDKVLDASEGTVEYYLAVQGLDGDDYVLAPQDKPLSIFKTLTAPFTTPMPSVSHIRTAAPQAPSSSSNTTNNSEASRSRRRPRSSSFSNYEQTSYDEDSVFRFYLHRRIKRPHEREGMIYIKVSLYPDEDTVPAQSSSENSSSRHHPLSANTTPSGKKKKLLAPRKEVDRIDKIMAVRQEHQVGTVINMALEKFHVPDAEAEEYQPSHYHPLAAMHGPTDRCLTKYRMSVRANGKETRLDPREHMATVFHQQQKSSQQGPVTTDLLFILRKAEPVQPQQRHSPPMLSPLDQPERMDHHQEQRRPSILDLLMDSPQNMDRRPSFPVVSTTAPAVNHLEARRPSAPTKLPSQERKGSFTPFSYQAPMMAGAAPASNNTLAPPSPLTAAGARRSSLLSISSTATADMDDHTSTTDKQQRKKENSFTKQLKRLVGWGSKSSKKNTNNSSNSSATNNNDNNNNQMLHQNSSSLSVMSPYMEHACSSQISVASAPVASTALLPSINRPDMPPGETPAPTKPTSPEPTARPRSTVSVSSSSSEEEEEESSSDEEEGDGEVDMDVDAESSDEEDSDEDESDQEEEQDTSQKTEEEPSEQTLQAQYALWAESTKSEEEQQQQKIATISPSSSGSTAASASASSSSVASGPSTTTATAVDVTTTTTTTIPAPPVVSNDMDDIYLLVTRGVDYLQSRESTKWDDEGGYDFHPWNRPDGSFAVRKKSISTEQVPADKTSEPAESKEEQEVVEAEKKQEEETVKEQDNQEQQAPKRSNSSKRSSTSSSSTSRPIVQQPPTQTESLMDEQELQLFVASHIVF